MKPSKVAEFREAVNEYLKIYRENDLEHAWNTYQTEDFHFYFTTPMKNYADIGNMLSKSTEITAKMGQEESLKLAELTYGSTENYHYGLFYARPDLS